VSNRPFSVRPPWRYIITAMPLVPIVTALATHEPWHVGHLACSVVFGLNLALDLIYIAARRAERGAK
jgi:hypothetical protein